MPSRSSSLMRLLLGPVLLTGLPAWAAQMPAAEPSEAAPVLSPDAAYDQAMSTIDIVRRSQGNWSEIEKNALNVAVQQAKEACIARASETYTGAELVSYARLCALGRQWSNADAAARSYITADIATKPRLTEAYSYAIQAELSLNREKDAVTACMEMLRTVPYSPLADDVSTSAFRYLQFAYTGDALRVLATRQPILLGLLRASQSGAAPSHDAAAPAAASIPIHTIYQHALDFAALEQYFGEPEAAAAILTEIERAMPSSLAPDDAILIAAARHQYSLLGTRFPELPGAVSLISAPATSIRQPQFGHPTVFFLFPPWCAQCIRQAQDMVQALVRTAMVRGPGNEVNMYALLADTPPENMRAAKSAPEASSSHTPRTHQPAKAATRHDEAAESSAAPKSAIEQLWKTPTLVVAPETITKFNASDFPFLIATDAKGIIRLMVPGAPENALLQDGPVDQITEAIATRWPADSAPH